MFVSREGRDRLPPGNSETRRGARGAVAGLLLTSLNADPIFGADSNSHDGLLRPAFPGHITVRVARNSLTALFCGYRRVRVVHDG
ncbi:unnamed protein product, partial [Musa hybrid cultivar]